MADERARITENPFYVLGLRPEATRQELEREGQKLLGMLELGLSASREYSTPLGRFERTPELVRVAMAELRDPERRLVHEVWACLPPELVVDLDDASTGGHEDSERAAPAWTDARSALGWGPR